MGMLRSRTRPDDLFFRVGTGAFASVLVLIVVGIGFVLYLLYAELVQIGNICLFCTGVHITTFLLFVLILFDFVFRQAPANTAASVSAKRTKG